MRDIVLIGMPGCGKTTIGRILSKKLNMEFFDSDVEIERFERLCIPEIFKNKGEKYFRKCETDALHRLLQGGRIIATGGGAILKKDNINLFNERNAFVVFIDRPVEMIVSDVKTDNRPLLANGKDKVYDLYNERYEKYMLSCDIRIINDKDAESASEEIIMLLGDY